MHAHVHTYRYTLVITHTDKHLDLITGLRGRVEYCVHASVYVYISGVFGEYWAVGYSALEAVLRFLFIFFFIALEEWGSLHQVSKN